MSPTCSVIQLSLCSVLFLAALAATAPLSPNDARERRASGEDGRKRKHSFKVEGYSIPVIGTVIKTVYATRSVPVHQQTVSQVSNPKVPRNVPETVYKTLISTVFAEEETTFTPPRTLTITETVFVREESTFVPPRTDTTTYPTDRTQNVPGVEQGMDFNRMVIVGMIQGVQNAMKKMQSETLTKYDYPEPKVAFNPFIRT